MKRFTYLLSSLAFVLTFSGTAFAQQITASAQILEQINYTVSGEINFDVLQASFTSATIDPENAASDAGVSGNATAARIAVSGSPDQTVLVNVPTSVDLAHTGSSTDVLTLTPDISGVTGTATTARGGAALTNGNELSLDTNGDGTLWLGGELTPTDTDGSGSIDVGTYKNTFNVTLNYF